MKMIDRYEFTNGKAFETGYLSADDLARMNLPECDVIAFIHETHGERPALVMRPDEALIAARLLINAVYEVTSEYEIEFRSPVRRGTDGRAYPCEDLT